MAQMVRTRTNRAVKRLTPQMYTARPQLKTKNAICSKKDKKITTQWTHRANHLSMSRKMSPAHPFGFSLLAEVYKFNNRLAEIENKTAAIVAIKLKYRRTRDATTVGGGPSHFGTFGMSPPNTVLSIS